MTAAQDLAAAKERIATLEGRNDRLADTLREARDQMMLLHRSTQEADLRWAILDAIEYSIIGIELRRNELANAITRNVVGKDSDDARRIPDESIADIFVAGLRARGYDVTRKPEAVSS